MQRLRLNTSIAIIILIGLCHTVLGAPSLRIKRSDVSDVSSISDANDLNPIVSEDSAIEDADRDKRTIVDKHSGKNAILGYVFSKIDSFLDAKTRFIDNLDQINVVKNKQHNIVAPKPIGSIKDVIAAVITPKITAITSSIGSLSGSFGGFSGGGGGGWGGATDDGSSAPKSAGLGGIVTSFLKFSGPILSSSSSSGHAGGAGGISLGGSAGISGDASDDDATTY